MILLAFLTRTDSKDHITPILKELHWLPVEARINYKILLLPYKALNGFGPVYIRELLHLKQHKRETRASRDFLMLEVPRTPLKTLGDRTFSLLQQHIGMRYLWSYVLCRHSLCLNSS